MDYNLFVIGDTTLDTFLRLDTKEASVVKEDGRQVLELRFADKIPVAEFHETIGGNSANAAVTGARMGLTTAIWTIMGADQVGERAKRSFEKEGVITDYFFTDEKIHSKVSTIINYGGERTIFIYGDHISYMLPQLGPAKWAYVSSMGEVTGDVYDDIAEWVAMHNVKLAYQPGTFQLWMGAEKTKKLLSVTEVILMNKEEATEYVESRKSDIRGQSSEIGIKSLLEGLLELGPKIAVITDGSNGAYVSDGKTIWSQGIDESVPVIEKTGAGDAYSSALVIALQKGHDIPTAMRWGAENSRSVIQKIGPQAGILTLDEMEKSVRVENASLRVTKNTV